MSLENLDILGPRGSGAQTLDEIIRLTVAVTRSSEPTTIDYFEMLNQRNALVRNFRTRIAALEAALLDIEMETRDGAQWTAAEINEVARKALVAAPSSPAPVTEGA